MVDISDNSPKDPEKDRRKAAVALKKFGIDESAIPKVVAAGYGKLAEEIVRLAFKNGIKVREDKDLAQILAAIELDSDIPSEALVAIAEILAYVYKANSTYQSPGEKMTNKAEDPSAVGKRLKSIVEYVRDCQVRVAKGEIMDLQGLDKNVIDICDAIAGLPEKEGQSLESQMSQLIDSLEQLGRMLKEQQDKFGAAAGAK